MLPLAIISWVQVSLQPFANNEIHYTNAKLAKMYPGVPVTSANSPLLTTFKCSGLFPGL